MLAPSCQLALRERPSGSAIMRQSWRDLLFLHFPCDPAFVQALLPEGLTVDTFPDESGVERAWIGLVPFLMKDVRWAFAPRVPGTHTFPETNVRTYVHRDGEDPGVWFFSLDAANPLAVFMARTAFSLPYFRASMSVERRGDEVVYRGRRKAAAYDVRAQIGDAVAEPTPGGLDFFLVERYLLYAFRRGRIWTGRVFHRPYALRSARATHVKESLVRTAGLPSVPFRHAVFSEGVDVEVFPLSPR